MDMTKPFLLACALAACDSQVDSGDLGTPLVTLHGSVANQRTQTTDDADVVVEWRSNRGPAIVAPVQTPVTGTFPAEFSLSVYEPPPPDFINTFANCQDPALACETPFAIAYLLAGPPGQTDFLYPSPPALGMDLGHLLVYVPDGVPAGSMLSKFLHATPGPGFHVFAIHKKTKAEYDARNACLAMHPDDSYAQMYDDCGGLIEVDDVMPLTSDLATSLEVTLVDDLASVSPVW